MAVMLLVFLEPVKLFFSSISPPAVWKQNSEWDPAKHSIIISISGNWVFSFHHGLDPGLSCQLWKLSQIV